MTSVPFHDDCAVVELRQYTLQPGQRDALIELFDREFVETQEATGMRVIGQFRDQGDADRFVWLRGFAGMPERARTLAAFYGGPVWQAHRDAANATMIDSDNVLLLRPAWPGAGLDLRGWVRAPLGSTTGGAARRPGLVVAQIALLHQAANDQMVGTFNTTVAPLLRQAGASIRACYVTEPSPNSFPRLPVREGENVFVWISSFDDAHHFEAHLRMLAGTPLWRDEVAPIWNQYQCAPTQVLRLTPTARSLFHA